ncbi:unnamed protein product [Dicrocoelium dendriticum]|nr:unnamed protein product [Dicrocoelium dendriticum]
MSCKCLDCFKAVTARSKAVQCSFCEGWLHVACCKIGADLYDQLQRTTSSVVVFICDPCRAGLSVNRVSNGLPPISPSPSCLHSVQKQKHPLLPPNDKYIPAGRTPVKKAGTDAAPLDGLPAPNPSFSSAQTEAISATASLAFPCLSSPTSGPVTPSGKPTDVDHGKAPNTKTYASVAKDCAPLSSPVRVAESMGKTDVKVKSKPLSSQSQLKLVLDRVGQLEKLLKEGPPLHNSQIPVNNKSPSRGRCLIIINAPESSKTTPAERIMDDQEFLKRMISLLLDEGEPGINIVSAFRLGKKQEDSSKVRPLKIVCQNDDEVHRILRRAPRLKGEPFFVLRDLSPEDRVKMKKAVDELRCRRDNGETDLHIVDFRVVRKTPRTRWRPLLVMPGR